VASSPRGNDPSTGTPSGSRFFFAPGERLWRIWWLWGIPTAWTTTALVLAAEEFRVHDWHAAGDFADVLRLAVYWAWCRLAWRCANNVGNRFWTLPAKLALAAGLVVTALS
jgi:hypothetical protein